MMLTYTVVFLFVTLVAGLPVEDPVIRKLDDVRYQHVAGDDGQLHLVDMWVKLSDVAEAARYNPDAANVYHLYTRDNPSVSHPMLINNEALLRITNYDPSRRTVIILHSWREDVISDASTILVPAFLEAEDVNVIVVDWSAGGGTYNYLVAVANSYRSGQAVARFIDWLCQATGGSHGDYHVVGFGFGGHQAGVVGRYSVGNVGYITALDPTSAGFILNRDKLQADDGLYTEVIHTNAGLHGYLGPLAHVDFYPNGGINMPGCGSQRCDQRRSIFYFAESLVSNGFTGDRCLTYIAAMIGNCLLRGNLNMGGLRLKTGERGIYWLRTSASPPFSLG